MARLFVDTWYFVAWIDPLDSHRSRLQRLALRFAGTPMLTHESVLTEVLAFFSAEGQRFRAGAVDAVRNAFTTLEVVSVDTPLFLRALDLYERRPDKEYSLTDCVSMVVMRERGITHVLTNDHHFRQEGFTVLSDAT